MENKYIFCANIERGHLLQTRINGDMRIGLWDHRYETNLANIQMLRGKWFHILKIDLEIEIYNQSWSNLSADFLGHAQKLCLLEQDLQGKRNISVHDTIKKFIGI